MTPDRTFTKCEHAAGVTITPSKLRNDTESYLCCLNPSLNRTARKTNVTVKKWKNEPHALPVIAVTIATASKFEVLTGIPG